MMQAEGRKRDKSLAWFKLADLIARGEREKALSVFRLLSHSLSDRAYVLQVEGDILWYLDDNNALDRYQQAAYLYQKEKRWVSAIAVYEHLLTIEPRSLQVLSQLMIFYCMVDWQERLNQRYLQFCDVARDDQLEKHLRELVSAVQEADENGKKDWFFAWLTDVLQSCPPALAERIKPLF